MNNGDVVRLNVLSIRELLFKLVNFLLQLLPLNALVKQLAHFYELHSERALVFIIFYQHDPRLEVFQLELLVVQELWRLCALGREG